jgi:hypothetical protein
VSSSTKSASITVGNGTPVTVAAAAWADPAGRPVESAASAASAAAAVRAAGAEAVAAAARLRAQQARPGLETLVDWAVYFPLRSAAAPEPVAMVVRR